MNYYDKTRTLHLETDAYGVGLGARLLQIRDGVTCPQDVAPHNCILRPIEFTIKCMSNMEKDAAAYRQRHYGYYMDCRVFTTIALPERYVLSQNTGHW